MLFKGFSAGFFPPQRLGIVRGGRDGVSLLTVLAEGCNSPDAAGWEGVRKQEAQEALD